MSFWLVLGRFSSFCVVLGQFRPPFASFWLILGFCPVLYCFGLFVSFWFVLGCFGIFRVVLAHFGSF